MSLDLALVKKVTEIHASKPRKFVTVAAALAVIEQESGGVLIFRGLEPLYMANKLAAAKITGLTPDEIVKAVTIGWGQYKGQISKFRCEPGYWQWAQQYAGKISKQDLLLMSCSFGLGQKMSRYLLGGLPQSEWLAFIRNFMGSPNLQIQYCLGDLDALLVGAKGDRALAFTRYNAGPGAGIKSPAYAAYGVPVQKKQILFTEQLKELK